MGDGVWMVGVTWGVWGGVGGLVGGLVWAVFWVRRLRRDLDRVIWVVAQAGPGLGQRILDGPGSSEVRVNDRLRGWEDDVEPAGGER